MSNEINNIENWFKAAKQNHTLEDACVQIGCHFEEVAEMIDAIFGNYNEPFRVISDLANEFKNKNPDIINVLEHLDSSEEEALLDSLCDQIVTATGVGQRLNMNIVGGLNNVIDSNWSKFVDGKPVFNDQGKIAKGPDYFPPKLDGFIK